MNMIEAIQSERDALERKVATLTASLAEARADAQRAREHEEDMADELNRLRSDVQEAWSEKQALTEQVIQAGRDRQVAERMGEQERDAHIAAERERDEARARVVRIVTILTAEMGRQERYAQRPPFIDMVAAQFAHSAALLRNLIAVIAEMPEKPPCPCVHALGHGIACGCACHRAALASASPAPQAEPKEAK